MGEEVFTEPDCSARCYATCDEAPPSRCHDAYDDDCGCGEEEEEQERTPMERTPLEEVFTAPDCSARCYATCDQSPPSRCHEAYDDDCGCGEEEEEETDRGEGRGDEQEEEFDECDDCHMNCRRDDKDCHETCDYDTCGVEPYSDEDECGICHDD